MEPLKLVIVEDEEAHFYLMKRAIEKEFSGASVHHFDEAAECLEKLDEIRPDVIIADYLIPGMNGIELLEALNREKRDTPVVMITGQGDENIAVQAMKLGAWDYMVKSADFFKLLPSTIEKVVRARKLRDSLRETERRFQDLADNTPNWIWEMDAQGKYTYSNLAVQSILGYGPDEVTGRYFHDFFIKGHKEAPGRAWLREMVEGKPTSNYVNRLAHRDGHEVIVETNSVPIFDKSENLLGYRGVNRDITRQKRAEEHIHYLTQQLMKAQESERQRLALDLHDLVGQDLSTLKIGIDTLLDGQREVPADVSQKVSWISGMLQKSIMAVRDLSYNLRPATLDQLGLVLTVHQHCEEFSALHGIKTEFMAAGMDDLDLDFDTMITLYRLVQEALNNVKKHANASNVTLRMVASFPKIILRIEDNGKGFDVQDRLVSALQERRMGLRSMEERVALLDGKMKIESRPSFGTKILIEVPCKENRVE